jgi:hypothetical protein
MSHRMHKVHAIKGGSQVIEEINKMVSNIIWYFGWD